MSCGHLHPHDLVAGELLLGHLRSIATPVPKALGSGAGTVASTKGPDKPR
jgi:hypothetical protein